MGKKAKKILLSFTLVISLLVGGFLSQPVKATDLMAGGSVSDAFTIENRTTESIGGSYSNDVFSITTQYTSNNGQTDGTRINYFDFRETFTRKTSSQRVLTSSVLYYDYMYYNVNYWGSNPMSTAMLWDNNIHSFILPNPWVVDETTTLDTTYSSSSLNNQGVKIFVNDLNPGTANVTDLTYLKKGNFTDVES